MNRGKHKKSSQSLYMKIEARKSSHGFGASESGGQISTQIRNTGGE